jgi:DNA-binding NarL/FixJ family response regulator
MEAETSLMTAPERPISILLADEHRLFASAVRVVLEGEPDLRVVADARDVMHAIDDSERTPPDVAVVHVSARTSDGIRGAALIREHFPDCRVVVLSDDEDHRALIEALEAGASGYVTKEAPLSDLIAAVRAVHRGETLVPPRMLGPLVKTLMRRRREHDEARRRVAQLTRREREVLALLAYGATKEVIAETLVISPQTARTHIQNILDKLSVHSQLEAVAFIRRDGILEELTDGSLAVPDLHGVPG